MNRLATKSRSPSLELVWPESPCQLSTTAGQPGRLSPASSRFVSLSAVNLQANRHLAVKQAWHLYATRSNRVVGVAENQRISVNRQAKR